MIFKNNLLGIRIKGLSNYRHTRLLRVMHWVLVPASMALIINGFYISNPSRAKSYHSMESARKMHFTAQYFLSFYYIARVYYALVTGDYRDLMPVKKDIAAVPGFLSYTSFLRRQKPHYPKYNPGQKFLFALMGVLFPLQMLTGYALYSTSRLQKLSRLFGGLGKTRLVHYLNATVITGLIAGHVYFAVTDSMEKLKSIFTGYYRAK